MALKHERQRFLSQSVVYSSVREEWVGGGYSEDYLHFVRKVVCGWVCYGWVVVPLSVVIQAIAAIFPPFELWYGHHFRLKERATIERQLLGLAFVPAFRYVVSKAGDVILAITLTSMAWFPFYLDEAQPTGLSRLHRTPVYGFSPSQHSTLHNAAMLFVVLYTVGGVIEEALRLFSALLGDIDFHKQWRVCLASNTRVLTKMSQCSIRQMPSSAAGSRARLKPDSPPNSPRAKAIREDIHVIGEHTGAACKQVSAALTIWGKALADGERWKKYWIEGVGWARFEHSTQRVLHASPHIRFVWLVCLLWFELDCGCPVGMLTTLVSTPLPLPYPLQGYDGILRVVCLATWLTSLSYGPGDLNTSSRSMLHPECLLSLTIVLLWLRSLQILEVFQTTGPLVVILGSIWKDVVGP